MRELGYVPHAGARSLSMSRTNALGVVLPDLHGEFFSEIVRGMDREASARGYLLLLSPLHGERERPAIALRAMRGRVDGMLLMAPQIDEEALALALPSGLPVVLMNTRADMGAVSIHLDNEAGARAVADHFLALGRRHIVHIAGPDGNIDAQERAAAFAQALASARRRAPAAARRLFRSVGRGGGRAAARRGARFDALFAANDNMAIGALGALRRAGIAVPEAVAVAGFDDIPLARHLGLTTVRVRIAELGQRAVSLLIDVLEGVDGPRGAMRHLPELVVRATTRFRQRGRVSPIDRRELLRGSAWLAAAAAVPALAARGRQPRAPSPLSTRTSRSGPSAISGTHVNRKNGLAPDRWPTPSFSSIAAVGFALTAYPVGVERGWCTRAEAADLTLTTLRFFWNAPQGPERTGTAGYKGFFYHFLDMETGLRFRDVELSSVDTTILLMGALFAGQYYDRDDAREREIRRLAEALYARADWNHFRSDGRPAISMGWHPERGLIERSWDGYNEGMFVNILALGAPVHQVPATVWDPGRSPIRPCGAGPARRATSPSRRSSATSTATSGSTFAASGTRRCAPPGSIISRTAAAPPMRTALIASPIRWAGPAIPAEIWGLTACDGPGNFELPYRGETRHFYGYAARGPIDQPDGRDDGTLAPTAALGSLPFAPEIVIPCAKAMIDRHGARLYGRYGFLDSFNPSFTYAGVKPETGSVDAKTGWVARDHLGIDQGPILLQAANYRDDFVWRHMRRVPAIRRGLLRAGFKGGWLG